MTAASPSIPSCRDERSPSAPRVGALVTSPWAEAQEPGGPSALPRARRRRRSPAASARSAQLRPSPGARGPTRTSAQRPDQALGRLRLALLERPGQNRPQVVVLGLQPSQPSPLRRCRTARDIARPASQAPGRPAAVASPPPRRWPPVAPARTPGSSPASRTADSPLRCSTSPHQALVHQRRDPVRARIGRGVSRSVRRRGSSTDRLGRRQREAAGEDRQPPEQGLLGRGEQVVAPGDGVAHRLQARRQVARAAGQQRQAVAQPGQQRRAATAR